MASTNVYYTEGDDEHFFPIAKNVKPEEVSGKGQRSPSQLKIFHPREWTHEQVAAWLKGLGKGYEQYVEAFREGGIDGDCLRYVNADTIDTLVKNTLHGKVILHHLKNAIWTDNSQKSSMEIEEHVSVANGHQKSEDSQQLDERATVPHQGDRYACNRCPRICSSSESLKSHMRAAHQRRRSHNLQAPVDRPQPQPKQEVNDRLLNPFKAFLESSSSTSKPQDPVQSEEGGEWPVEERYVQSGGQVDYSIYQNQHMSKLHFAIHLFPWMNIKPYSDSPTPDNILRAMNLARPYIRHGLGDTMFTRSIYKKWLDRCDVKFFVCSPYDEASRGLKLPGRIDLDAVVNCLVESWGLQCFKNFQSLLRLLVPFAARTHNQKLYNKTPAVYLLSPECHMVISFIYPSVPNTRVANTFVFHEYNKAKKTHNTRLGVGYIDKKNKRFLIGFATEKSLMNHVKNLYSYDDVEDATEFYLSISESKAIPRQMLQVYYAHGYLNLTSRLMDTPRNVCLEQMIRTRIEHDRNSKSYGPKPHPLRFNRDTSAFSAPVDKKSWYYSHITDTTAVDPTVKAELPIDYSVSDGNGEAVDGPEDSEKDADLKDDDNSDEDADIEQLIDEAEKQVKLENLDMNRQAKPRAKTEKMRKRRAESVEKKGKKVKKDKKWKYGTEDMPEE